MPANIHVTKRIKYETIFKCKEYFSVRKMCKVLGVRESGMYPERVEKINPKTNSKEIDNTEGIIFHSDRGSQYRSKGYKNMLDENKIISSMIKSGCPYDNSCVEGFFAILKKECIYRKSYAIIEEIASS